LRQQADTGRAYAAAATGDQGYFSLEQGHEECGLKRRRGL
jgi:hypothetical protein